MRGIRGRLIHRSAANLSRLAPAEATALKPAQALETVWKFADLAMGLMTIVNLAAMLLLSPVALRVMRDYTDQLRAGSEPVFDRKKFPDLEGRIEEDVW